MVIKDTQIDSNSPSRQTDEGGALARIIRILRGYLKINQN